MNEINVYTGTHKRNVNNMMYTSTTLYYKVLLQYYSVLQSATPVLLCTTKYYSSTTVYYKVLFQYYTVLQSTIPHPYETALTMRGATGVTIQLHQILRLPHKMNLKLDPRHLWNVIYNARSNRSHNPTAPNTAPATQNESQAWSASLMKRHLQCAEQQESQSNCTKYCACHAKCISWLISVTYETSFTMRGATGVTIQLHQILRLPRKMHLMIDQRHLWNVIYNARSNTGYHATSPNTAPATKFWVQDVSGNSLNCFRQYKDDSTRFRR